MSARTLGLSLVFAVVLAAPARATTHDPRGHWQGKLEGKLRIVVHVSADSAGGLAATIDSPDQGAFGLAARHTTFASDTLDVELMAPVASYVGRMSDDGARLDGAWHQGGQSIPLTLARADSTPARPRRPQEPQRPYPYVEEDVSYPGGDGLTFAGTLTRPQGSGPFPCALLITGSGPQDRDETILGHKPFLVIADRLTRAGIAVLRVDDRGVGGSSRGPDAVTSDDFTGDALAGVRYLKTRASIDSTQIGLIGHSEGGLIAPLAATRSRDVAFIVLLAGPGVPGEQILYAQGEAIARSMGASDAEIAQERRVQEKLFALMKQDLDSVTVARRVRAIFTAELMDSARIAQQVPGAMAVARSAWFRHFLTYDPRPTLRRVRCPVLAMNGSKDVQVPPRQNLPEIERALKAGGNRDVTVRELPRLNHLFQTCTTGAPTEYATIEETFAPAALDTLTAWITAHTRRPR